MTVFEFSSEAFSKVVNQARTSMRLRSHLTLHAGPEEKFQRMLVAMEPASYIQPHRHLTPLKPELLTVLRGAVAVLIFSVDGSVTRTIHCSPGGNCSGCEIEGGIWHTILSLESGSVFLEAKPGPYEKLVANDFAPWAPAEGEADVAVYHQELRDQLPAE